MIFFPNPKSHYVTSWFKSLENSHGCQGKVQTSPWSTQDPTFSIPPPIKSLSLPALFMCHQSTAPLINFLSTYCSLKLNSLARLFLLSTPTFPAKVHLSITPGSHPGHTNQFPWLPPCSHTPWTDFQQATHCLHHTPISQYYQHRIVHLLVYSVQFCKFWGQKPILWFYIPIWTPWSTHNKCSTNPY